MKKEYVKPKFTPEKINTLQIGEIFVFGSDLKGNHAGGAARTALNSFGAVLGIGDGLQGQSYAIPTMQGGPETIKPYVDKFIAFAKENKEMTFLVTQIGCGIAGFQIEEIAPLFKEALNVENIVLPKSFVYYLLRNTESELPDYLKTKIYGQTRTLVDMLIELNKQNNYTSANKAIQDLWALVDSIQDGNNVSFNCGLRSINALADKYFENGALNMESLKESLYHDFYEGIDAVYENYVVEKTVTLVSYLNDFRRYTNRDSLMQDLLRIIDGINNSRLNPEDYYSFSHAYVKAFFDHFTTKFWNEFSKHGVMDNELFFDFMIGRHNRGIEKYGLEAVIKRNYKDDSPCHPEVYFPYRGGAAPVYVSTSAMTYDMEVAERRFIKSCGEGKGPFSERDYLEFYIVFPLLEEDEKYVRYGNFFIPRNDVTLPVFFRGRVLFATKEDHEGFIRNTWKKMNR